MKNIKVNYTNQDGKRTSTTINKSICEYYYYATATDEERMTLKDWCENDTKGYVEMRNKILNKMAQEAADTVTKETIERGVLKGTDQKEIECYMLEKIMLNRRY